MLRGRNEELEYCYFFWWPFGAVLVAVFWWLGYSHIIPFFHFLQSIELKRHLSRLDSDCGAGGGGGA